MTSLSSVCMGRKSVIAVAATTGCFNGIVLFRHWRMATPLKPSLSVSPPRRHRRSRAHDSNPCRPSVLPPPNQRGVPVFQEALPHGGRGRASETSRTHHTYTVGEEGMQGKGISTTRGVSKKAARGSRWLASWCSPGTQCIQPVRVDASPSTSSQHSHG